MKYVGREKEYMHEYYLANKKKIRARNDAWESEHADEDDYNLKFSDDGDKYKFMRCSFNVVGSDADGEKE